MNRVQEKKIGEAKIVRYLRTTTFRRRTYQIWEFDCCLGAFIEEPRF